MAQTYCTCINLHQLIAFCKVYSNTLYVQAKLDTLESQLRDQPEKSFQVVISKLQEPYDTVEDILRNSTIPQVHSIRWLVLDLEPHIMNLSSTDKSASTLSLHTSSASSSTHSQVKLPKLALPLFHGDPMKWAAFWERFDTAVPSNPNLDNGCKLTYLKEAIKYSKVIPLLHRATSSSTQYDDLVYMLTERYDQKRLVHQYYSMLLVESAPI